MGLRDRRRLEKRIVEASSGESVPYQRAVLHLYDWQHRGARHFFTDLFELMTRADEENMLRLAIAFPQHSLALQSWKMARTDREFFEAAGFLMGDFN
jgi:hypothetical protein